MDKAEKISWILTIMLIITVLIAIIQGIYTPNEIQIIETCNGIANINGTTIDLTHLINGSIIK